MILRGSCEIERKASSIIVSVVKLCEDCGCGSWEKEPEVDGSLPHLYGLLKPHSTNRLDLSMGGPRDKFQIRSGVHTLFLVLLVPFQK